MIEFIKYRITAEALCLGERTKGGIFRPCVKTIPYSQITGALRTTLGLNNIHAVGYLYGDNAHNKVKYLTYSPRDRFLDKSKVPLCVEYLTNVYGYVFVVNHQELRKKTPENFVIYMGGLKSKGFGRCKLEMVEVVKPSTSNVPKKLNVRVPLRCLKSFAIKRVIKPIYGYLFKPTSRNSGVYELSLFEESIVIAPEILLRTE